MPEIQPVQPGTGDANMHDTARLRVGLLPRDGGMKARYTGDHACGGHGLGGGRLGTCVGLGRTAFVAAPSRLVRPVTTFLTQESSLGDWAEDLSTRSNPRLLCVCTGSVADGVCQVQCQPNGSDSTRKWRFQGRLVGRLVAAGVPTLARPAVPLPHFRPTCRSWPRSSTFLPASSRPQFLHVGPGKKGNCLDTQEQAGRQAIPAVQAEATHQTNVSGRVSSQPSRHDVRVNLTPLSQA
jgi:hypothetical protein